MVDVTALQSIPRVLRGILLGFLTILMIRFTYPVSNYLLGLFTGTSTMSIRLRVAAILGYWLIIIFVTTTLIWITLFKPEQQEVKNYA